MKLGMFLGIALVAVGGAAYAHKRRGGTLTLDSIKESVKLAKDGLNEQFNVAKDKVAGLVASATPAAPPAASDRFGYSEYTVAKTERDLH